MKKLMMLLAFGLALAVGFSTAWSQECPMGKDKCPMDKDKKEHRWGERRGPGGPGGLGGPGMRRGGLEGPMKEVVESPEGKKEMESHQTNMKAIMEERKKLFDTMREEVKKLVGDNAGVKDSEQNARATVWKNNEVKLRELVNKSLTEMMRHREAMMTIAKAKQKEISDGMMEHMNKRFLNARDGKRGPGGPGGPGGAPCDSCDTCKARKAESEKKTD